MKLPSIDLNHSVLTWIIIVILVALTTGIIVYFLPRKAAEKYAYGEEIIGKPWAHERIISDEDFPVFKSEETLRSDSADLRKKYKCAYQKNLNIGETAIRDFNAAVENDTTGVLKTYQPSIVRILHSIYDRGIMSMEERDKVQSDFSDTITIFTGKYGVSECINDLPKVTDLYDRLFLDDELTQHRDELEKFNLNNYVRPNLIYEETTNESGLRDLFSGIAPTKGSVSVNEKIVDRGEIVNEDIYQKIDSYYKKKGEDEKDDDTSIQNMFIGQSIFVFLFVLLYSIYLKVFRYDFFKKPRNLLMLYLMIIVFSLIVSFMVRRILLSIYIVPFAIVPIITRVFFDSRTAIMTHAATIVIASVAVSGQYDFVIIEMAAGIAAIYSLGDMSKRANLFTAALAATACAFVVYYALEVMHTKQLLIADDSRFFHLAVSGIGLLLAYPLMYVIEKVFGFLSKITFYELSDTNQPLLRMLSEKAPGTFAHSTTVGNLAAEIARRIGADQLLVRTGALYHDIGKMDNPAFFVENQAGFSPHSRLTEKESAKVIIEHVSKGLASAEKYGLPDVIKGFIYSHHGKGMANYFYVKYKNSHPKEEVDPALFSYPGPNPETKEQAILMMADTVEAASKSLDEYTDETISKLVNELIDKQVSEGFFYDCPITFHDIAVAKQVLIERLKSIYHTRVKYPEERKQE
ncbi:MAG: HDIG domain-containing protein [Prevotella sp.]|nr:HDIG domain-containing protein [Prevotella sp.]